MGKGRDKKKKLQKKSNKGVSKKAHNQTKREELNEQKRERREERAAQGGEDDIHALLAQVALHDKKVKQTEEIKDVDPPTPRCNCTFTPLANHVMAGASGQQNSRAKSAKHEVLLYGGEYFDGRKTYVYGDLYKLDLKKKTWTQIVAKKPPKPRSGHQSFAYKGYFYTFGGEYTSPNQKNFNHYRDFWRLDLTSYEWEKLAMKGASPSARSGHRVVVVKGKAILFGGFYDTGKELKYYNDLWVFDMESLKWSTHGQPGQHCPSPRSGFQFFCDETEGQCGKVYLYGGYSKQVDEDDEEHGVTHDDMWCLDLGTMLWERIKKNGICPTKRAGSTIVTHKKNAVAFGGVVDHEVEDNIYSEFFNDMFNFKMDKRRWFPMVIRNPGSKGPGIMGQTYVVKKGSAALTKEEKAATKIQAHFRGYSVRKAYKVYRVGGKVGELLYSPAVVKAGGKVIHPPPRNKGSLVVLDNVLWLYGGTFEEKDREVTLDDLWSINLNKLDGWTCHEKGTFVLSEQDADSSEDDDDDMEMDSEELEMMSDDDDSSSSSCMGDD
ncbi:hypothetical protein HOP50_18g81330 [Chloropicon primus]|uniref:Galactose oxidase n=1 Tax=Chloropicon primus TaxID=1764295 RepID=A0A5B8MZ02_9CHLO|nr:hypothetical protein A3770_18p81090 [Chloropicon primus]UPR04788.1 hypothetical protein HOP50_18g81330 [Chloropicon primus]|eukprot:QDZ25591.1 hypothetical protein A3770_18p81090 [Chloropicon primus]